MKRMFTLLPVFLLLLLTSKTYSQIVWTFNDSLATPSANLYPGITAGPVTANNSTVSGSGIAPTAITQTSTSRNYPNFSGTYNIGVSADTSLTRGLNTATSAYFEFTLTPQPLASLPIATIGFGVRSTSTGPRNISIRTSLDEYASDLATDMVENSGTWTERIFTGLTLTISTPITMRIYGYGGAGNLSAGVVNWRIDDITINGGAVLPVTLSNFTASVVSNKVQLNWTTASETNLKGFSVEKSSDGKTFSEVSYVAASGKGNYSAQDAVSSGVVYYRLKMINLDGSFAYSNNIPVNALLAASSALRVYPNPVVNSAIVAHPQAGAGTSLKITDLNGRVMQSYPLQTGAVQTTINVSKLMSGTYMLIYRDTNGKAISTRLVKQ